MVKKDKLIRIYKNEDPDRQLIGQVISYSQSVDTIFKVAEKIRRMIISKKEHRLLDVPLIMAAMIYQPGKIHKKQMMGWKFNFENLANSFLGFILKNYPNEYKIWAKIHKSFSKRSPQPIQPSDPDQELILEGYQNILDFIIKRPGPSPPPPVEEIGTIPVGATDDLSTTEDALGYDLYTKVLLDFIRNAEPPLAISIQGAWGSGKTSLMKMIRKELDEKGYELSEKEEELTKDKSTDKLNNSELIKLLNKIENNDQNEFDIINVIHSLFPKEDQKIEKKKFKKTEYPTIWFNVWKYESTEQIWAGLLHAIVTQYAQRLTPKQQQMFYFYLNIQRQDPNEIRNIIKKRISNYWWQKMYPWLTGFGTVGGTGSPFALGGTISNNLFFQIPGAIGLLASLIGGSGAGIVQYIKQNENVEKEAAELSFYKYVTVPDYEEKLGFVHHAEKDLHRILSIIRKHYLKNQHLIIFIDDLDRCSPSKVADVIEGINLFLGGYFKKCIFIVALDPDMVSAALEVAYKNVISKLPKDVTRTSIGWRFMNKFIQLPFTIPPPEKPNLEDYTRTILNKDIKTEPEPVRDEIITKINEAIEKEVKLDVIRDEVKKISEEYNIPEEQQINLTYNYQKNAQDNVVKETTVEFSPKDEWFKEMVLKTAPEFSKNPREIKRFINLLRLNFILMRVRQKQGRDHPTKEQLKRWILLSMKWPEVVRWLRRDDSRRGDMELETEKEYATPENTQKQVLSKKQGKKQDEIPLNDIRNRLKQLERLGEFESFEKWLNNIKEKLYMDPNRTRWIANRELYEFFKQLNEDVKNKKIEPLSEASGKGFW